MSNLAFGVTGLLLLLLLLAASMPVGFAMTVVGVLGFGAAVSWPAAFSLLVSDYYDTFSSYGLTVIPLFVLMGQVAYHTGISRKLFDTAQCWLGAFRGGLAMAAVGACSVFGAICGSGPATAATMAAVALPEMKRLSYAPSLAAGTVAAAGGLGMLIPPSVVLIVYGVMTEQSIEQLFLAALLPGVLLTALFVLTVWILCLLDPSLAPPVERVSWRRRWKSLRGVLEIALLCLLVMGGMFTGFFTPTEAAAVGAAGSIAIAVVSRKFTWRMLAVSLSETLRTSCMVMFIIAGATVFGHFLQITDIPTELASWLGALPLPGWCVMALILLFYLVGGTFLDALALVLLTTSIFYPVVLQLGYDPVWFGVMVVLVTQMGVITPPVGVNVYVVSGMDRSVPLQAVFRGAMPYLLALFAGTILLMLFPAIATFLPSLGK